MNKKPPSEQEFLEQAYGQGWQLPPLSIRFQKQRGGEARQAGVDAIAEVTWQQRHYEFAVEYKPRSIPSMLRQAVWQVQASTAQGQLHPLVVVPYLDEQQLGELEKERVSGVDLCGNGIILVPEELLVFRTGAPNRFRDSAPIKNVYRGTSSLVARVFLLEPRYAAVTDIHAEIRHRGGDVALSTVSKALKALEEDLIVGRESGTIRLLQPEKLLEKLDSNFRRPEVRRALKGKVPLAPDVLMRGLSEKAEEHGLALAVTGLGSVNAYSVMAREPVLSLYCSDVERLLEKVDFAEAHRFPNLEVLETVDETAYFDRRSRDAYPWASPLQAYLELMQGDKRDRETAESIQELILRASRGLDA